MSTGAAPLRDWRERVRQTLWFEGVGLLLVAPAYALLSGRGAGESLGLIAALSLTVTLWAALFNTAFDRLEWRLQRRVASDRPPRWRALHAVLHEATAVAVSCPVIVTLTGLGWLDALLLDLALTAVYTLYAYAFHCVYDRLRPVRAAPSAPVSTLTAPAP